MVQKTNLTTRHQAYKTTHLFVLRWRYNGINNAITNINIHWLKTHQHQHTQYGTTNIKNLHQQTQAYHISNLYIPPQDSGSAHRHS